MTLDGQLYLISRHTNAIVGDGQALAPAFIYFDINGCGFGIKGVFDQLFDSARRAFNHLAGGDAIDGVFWQSPDDHGGPLGQKRTTPKTSLGASIGKEEMRA